MVEQRAGSSGLRRIALSVVLIFGTMAALTGQALAQPSNDNRGGAIPLSGAALNFGGSNLDATTESGERLTCNPINGNPQSTRYDATVWFTYDPPSPGTALVNAAPGPSPYNDGVTDVVLAVYDAGGAFVGCVDHLDPTAAEGSSFFIPGSGDPAAFPIQIGGFNNGINFEEGLFTLTISFARAPKVNSSLKYGFERFKKFTLLKRLKVNSEAGATTTVDCRGRGCPFRQERDFTLANVNASGLFKKAHLKGGAKVDIFVTEPNTFGSYTKLKFRPPRPPKKKVACIAAGDTDPTIQDVVPCQ